MMDAKNRKPQYINDLLKVIKTFFRYAQKEEYIQVNPAESIKNVKQPKVKIITFSELEIRRMLGHYHGRDYLSVRNRTLLALFFDTGMRLNEVITLCADQIRDEYILVHALLDAVTKYSFECKVRKLSAVFSAELVGRHAALSQEGPVEGALISIAALIRYLRD